jgi:enoyl-CoA hydratase
MARTEKQSLPVLLREDRGAVSILTLNRPEKLNALNNELISALMNALDGIELDHAIRAIVVTGAGRAFSSGADIAAFQRYIESGPAEAVAHFMRPGHRMTRRVESFPKPIIAAVNGLAFGGGCELVEATHIALAAEKASFSKAEINIGIIPTFGGTQRLPRNVGRKAAIELILTGRTFDATEAARLGLINRVAPGFELLEEAVKLGEALAMKPPLTWLQRWRPFIAAWMRRSTTAWRSRRLHLPASSRLTMLERVWRHSWRNVARRSSADNAVGGAGNCPLFDRQGHPGSPLNHGKGRSHSHDWWELMR